MAGKGLLLRAFLDTGSLPGGGYYSPLHPELGCATLIPVPEEEAPNAAEGMDPSRWVDPCTGSPLERFMPYDRRWMLHNDPRLDLGFYTDYFAPRGRLPRRLGVKLGKGDVLGFVAGLAVYPEGFWERRRSLAEVRRAFRGAVAEGRAAVYVVGFIEVEAVVDISATGWSTLLSVYPKLRESPHYAREGDAPVAVIGQGYLVEPPCPASTPSASIDRQPPSELLQRVAGREAALAFSRSNYRRSRVLRLSARQLAEELQREGCSVKKPG
ncbi:MAG: hypothetical protein ABWW70_05255 [Thermoproteota archaeon]